MKILGKEYRQDVINSNLWHRQEGRIIKTIDLQTFNISVNGFKSSTDAHNYLMKHTRKRNYETNNVNHKQINAKFEIFCMRITNNI